MLSASDKVKAVDVVEDAARWHGAVDTKSAAASYRCESSSGKMIKIVSPSLNRQRD